MINAERITIYRNGIDLGKIDLLVSEGLYTNRDHFFRSAVRNQFMEEDLTETYGEQSMELGMILFSRDGKSFRLA